MLVRAWVTVLFHTLVLSEPATWMPMPAPSIRLEAIVLPLETSTKTPVGTLTKYEARTEESRTPSSNQTPDCRLVSHEDSPEWSVPDCE